MAKSIAIIGMAAILPGAADITEYWDNIITGKDCIADIQDSYWNIKDYYDPDPSARDKTYGFKAGMVGSIEFDSIGFGIPPIAMESISVEQLYALVAARRALLDAGLIGNKAKPFNNDKTGVILAAGVGKNAFSYSRRQDVQKIKKILLNSGADEALVERVAQRLRDAELEWTENSEPGFLANVTAGRIANRFNLNGTNCAVDAACASGLAALKIAVEELQSGDSDIMLTGGVNLDLSPTSFISFCKTPAISKRNISSPFDTDADGMILGDGVAMVVLKRLEDAERDKDRIYAVIKSVGSSGDGRAKSIFAPSAQGQMIALERAYEKAEMDPASVTLIEAHGTGTFVGDECELTALNQVFTGHGAGVGEVAIGSVKSQIGHTRLTAGMAGLLKTALALYHKTLPPTINVKKERPDLAASPFYTLSSPKPWITSEKHPVRRAGLSSFGFGGANFHAVLEEYRSTSGNNQRFLRLHRIPACICLYAVDNSALINLCETYINRLSADTIAYDAILDEQHEPGPIPADQPRIGFVAKDCNDAINKLRIAVGALREDSLRDEFQIERDSIFYRAAGIADVKIVTLFSGQGTQYAGMFNEIARDYPEMSDFFKTIGTALEAGGDRPIADILYVPESRRNGSAALNNTEYTQPALAAVCGGIYEILRNRGYSDDFLIGHSFGEITGLWAGGAIDAQAFANITVARGQAMAAGSGETGMLVATACRAACEEWIKTYDNLYIANENCIDQTAISGDIGDIRALASVLKNAAVPYNILNVSQAFHSPYMAEPNLQFRGTLDAVEFKPLKKTLYSGADGKPYGKSASSVKETITRQIEQPVRFIQCVEDAYENGARVFVEIGPGRVLTNLVNRILDDKKIYTVAVNGAKGNKSAHVQLEEAIVKLRTLGLRINGDAYRRPVADFNEDKKPKSAYIVDPHTYLTPAKKAIVDAAIDTVETVKPVEAVKSVETVKPVEMGKPGETVKPVETVKPAAAATPVRQTAVAMSTKPTAAVVPVRQSAAAMPVRQTAATMLTRAAAATLSARHTTANMPIRATAATMSAKSAAATMPVRPTAAIMPVAEIKAVNTVDAVGMVNTVKKVNPGYTVKAIDTVVPMKPDSQSGFGSPVDRIGNQAGLARPAAISAVSVSDRAGAARLADTSAVSASERNVRAVNNGDIGKGDVRTSDIAEPSGTLSGFSDVKGEKTMERGALDVVLGIQSLNSQALERFLTSQGQQINVFTQLMRDSNGASASNEFSRLMETFQNNSMRAFETYMKGQREILLGMDGADTIPADLTIGEGLYTDAGEDSASLVVQDGFVEAPQPIGQTDLPEFGEDIASAAPAQLYPRVREDSAEENDGNIEHKGTFPPHLQVVNLSDAAAAASGKVDIIPEDASIDPKIKDENVSAFDRNEAFESDFEEIDPVQMIIRIISDKTGYPEDMVDADMNLESDLGIDSIKRIEVFSELNNQIPGKLNTEDIEAIAMLHTITEMGEYIKKKTSLRMSQADEDSGLSLVNPTSADNRADIEPGAMAVSGSPVIKRYEAGVREAEKAERSFPLSDSGAVVIIQDDSGVAELVAQKIQNMGYHTQLAALPEADETAVEQMFADILAKANQPLIGFIYIASVNGALMSIKENMGNIGKELFPKSDIDALKSVFLCAKYFTRIFKAESGHGFFISAARIDGRLGLGTGGSIVQGGLFGLHKSLEIEWQETIFTKAVDLAKELPPETAADYLMDEIFNINYSCPEIGRALNGKRYALYLTESYPGSDLRDNGPEPGDVLLVTGGGRGITAQCAVKLAQRCQCGFILLGRTDINADIEWTEGVRDRAKLREMAVARHGAALLKPSEADRLVDAALNQMEVQDTLEAIHSAGGRASYVSCDVRDVERLRKILEESKAKLGPVTGIVHGAGNIADKRIQRKTAADFDNVFGSKVAGLDACLRCVDARKLKYLILFSSTSGYFGNIGQSDYAMANEVFNKFAFAFKREYPGCKAVAINWGLWDAGSMASDSIRNMIKGSEIRMIPVETGTDYFIEQFVYRQKPETCQIVINYDAQLIRPEVRDWGVSNIEDISVNKKRVG